MSSIILALLHEPWNGNYEMSLQQYVNEHFHNIALFTWALKWKLCDEYATICENEHFHCIDDWDNTLLLPLIARQNFKSGKYCFCSVSIFTLRLFPDYMDWCDTFKPAKYHVNLRETKSNLHIIITLYKMKHNNTDEL